MRIARHRSGSLRFTTSVIVCLMLLWAPVQGNPVANGISLPGLPAVSDAAWDNTAVRKVLHAFAYGGQARDAQIRDWARMPPARAIVEILSFEPHNPKLSPPGVSDEAREFLLPGTLRSLSDYWASDRPGNRMPPGRRYLFRVDEWNAPRSTWLHAARMRGLNPFRERIGFFETNVHMAVNLAAGVTTWQMIRYYDDILAALRAGKPYEEVIAVAAASAAVARQYGHEENWFYDGECYCNEDFAREIHQLFFGILGTDDPDYHEQVTIKNTAAALTGMPIVAREAPYDWAGAYVDFRSEGHHSRPLEILGTTIRGATAREKIHAIAKVAIEHEESLDNLPVIIIGGLADDNLTPAKRERLRRAWRAMGHKSLLRFLRAYAISTMFHSEDRVKYHNSIERHLITANRAGLSNPEHFRDLMENWRLEWVEGVRPFEPAHDVFGAQTGPEAANSAQVFRLNYNDMTQSGWRFSSPLIYYEDRRPLERNWGSYAPRMSGGRFQVDAVAEWLWQRLLADGLKNYGDLERAQLHALLATGKDFGAVAFPSTPNRPMTPADFADGGGPADLAHRLGKRSLALQSADEETRHEAKRRVGQAVNFILATPYAFAQEGR